MCSLMRVGMGMGMGMEFKGEVGVLHVAGS